MWAVATGTLQKSASRFSQRRRACHSFFRSMSAPSPVSSPATVSSASDASERVSASSPAKTSSSSTSTSSSNARVEDAGVSALTASMSSLRVGDSGASSAPIESAGAVRVRRVGVVHDDAMAKHKQRGHPERPERVTAILQRLKEQGLYERCVRLPAAPASEEDILRCHSARMLKQLKDTGFAPEGDTLHVDGDTFCNRYSYRAALLAAGSVQLCAKAVHARELDAAFAFVRPPGHHAEADKAMGFCLFNSTAVAAQYARHVLGCARVAILDWDVHHGNGTQHIFESDPSVMYLSVHKGGTFYPGTGKAHEIGTAAGAGFTVNCPFLQSGMHDGDYLTLFRYVFMPIVREFNPDLFIISAGFDCAAGDLLGPMRVTPKGFAHMMQHCLDAAPQRVLCALEGGYDLTCTALGAEACIETLLGTQPPAYDRADALAPSTAGLADILACIHHLKPHWKCLRDLDSDAEWQALLKSMQPKLKDYVRPHEDEDRCKTQ